jgi:hypothetical protein
MLTNFARSSSLLYLIEASLVDGSAKSYDSSAKDPRKLKIVRGRPLERRSDDGNLGSAMA